MRTWRLLVHAHNAGKARHGGEAPWLCIAFQLGKLTRKRCGGTPWDADGDKAGFVADAVSRAENDAPCSVALCE